MARIRGVLLEELWHGDDRTADRRMSYLYFATGELNADGTVEQGSDGRDAELCRIEHARDGRRSYSLSYLRAVTQCPARRARSAGQFRRDAPRRARPRENALARRTFWARPSAAWLCGRRAVLAEAR